MKAAILRGTGKAFEIRDDVTVDGPHAGEVRIRLHASGVCHSDLSIRSGVIGDGSQFPGVLGHEGAGVVTEVGAGVANIAVGDHVVFSWVTPCGTCVTCVAGQTHLCMTHMMSTMAASPRLCADGEGVHAAVGAFAEEMVVPEAAAIKIDNDIPLDIAALIGCGVMTGVGAVINTAEVEAGSTVVVFGCGGVGLNVIQGARIAGATEIVAVDLVPEKLEKAKEFGATYQVAPDDLQELSLELTGGVGFDYAFEVVGRSTTIRAAYDATRRGGTTVVVGAGSPTDEVSFNAMELFFMEKRILGSFYGSGNARRDFPRLLKLWRSGQLNLEGLVSQRIQLEDLDEAFDQLERGEVIRSLITL